MFDYMGAISSAQWCCPCGQCHHQKVIKTITWLLLSRLPGNKPHRNSPEPSELCLQNLCTSGPTCLRNLPPQLASGTYTSPRQNSAEPSTTFRNLHQHTLELSGTLHNLPEPTPAHTGTLRSPTGTLRNPPQPSGTYTSTHRNSSVPSTTFRNLHQHTPELSAPQPSGTYTSTHRNSPQPSTTFRNLHQHTLELSGTFHNLPEPTPAHTGTLRNPPQPSGTYTTTHRNSPEPSTTFRNLHQHTPELSGTLHNLPEPTPAHTRTLGTLHNLPEPTTAHTGTLRNPPQPSGTYTSTHWNSPEPSTTFRNLHQHRNPPEPTCLRNLHQHTPELSGTFRNLPSEPAPATRTGTHRSLSGLKNPWAYAVKKVWSARRELARIIILHSMSEDQVGKTMLSVWAIQPVSVQDVVGKRSSISFAQICSTKLFEIIPFFLAEHDDVFFQELTGTLTQHLVIQVALGISRALLHRPIAHKLSPPSRIHIDQSIHPWAIIPGSVAKQMPHIFVPILFILIGLQPPLIDFRCFFCGLVLARLPEVVEIKKMSLLSVLHDMLLVGFNIFVDRQVLSEHFRQRLLACQCFVHPKSPRPLDKKPAYIVDKGGEWLWRLQLFNELQKLHLFLGVNESWEHIHGVKEEDDTSGTPGRKCPEGS